MNRLIRIFAAAACTITAHSIYPVIRQATILEHPETGQTVYALFDVHADAQSGILTAQQQHDIIAGATKHNAAVIAEDMGSFSEEEYLARGLSSESCAVLYKRYVDEQYFPSYADEAHIKLVAEDDVTSPENHEDTPWLESYNHTPLYNLVARCPKHIPTYNAEFRAASAASLSGDNITLRETVAVNDAVIEELGTTQQKTIAQYCEYLTHNYYSNHVTQMVFDHAHDCPEQYLANVVGPSLDLDTLDLFDADLLNGTLLKGLDIFKDHKTIIMCAGGYHLECLMPIFKRMGYTEKATFGGQRWSDEEEKHAIIPVVNLHNVFGLNQAVQTAPQAPLTFWEHTWNLLKSIFWFLV